MSLFIHTATVVSKGNQLSFGNDVTELDDGRYAIQTSELFGTCPKLVEQPNNKNPVPAPFVETNLPPKLKPFLPVPVIPVPPVPATKPQAPSLLPDVTTPKHCRKHGSNFYPLTIMTTLNSQSPPKDIYIHVERKFKHDTEFRAMFRYGKEPSLTHLKCYFNFRHCYKFVVYSRSGAGIGDGSIKADWRGKSNVASTLDILLSKDLNSFLNQRSY